MTDGLMANVAGLLGNTAVWSVVAVAAACGE